MASDLSPGADRSELFFRFAPSGPSIWDRDFWDGGVSAWTGNLVEPLGPVKWLDLRVRPCPSVSIG